MDSFDDFNAEYEFTDDLKPSTKTFKYSVDDSFYKKGGYVE